LREKTSDGLEIVGRIVRNTDQELIVREGVYKGIPIVDMISPVLRALESTKKK